MADANEAISPETVAAEVARVLEATIQDSFRNLQQDMTPLFVPLLKSLQRAARIEGRMEMRERAAKIADAAGGASDWLTAKEISGLPIEEK